MGEYTHFYINERDELIMIRVDGIYGFGQFFGDVRQLFDGGLTEVSARCAELMGYPA
jgi:hypothetical protein